MSSERLQHDDYSNCRNFGLLLCQIDFPRKNIREPEGCSIMYACKVQLV